MKSIITGTQEIVLGEDGIITCKVFPGKFLELQDAVDSAEAMQFLSQGNRAAVLMDISGTSGVSREFRGFLSGKQFAGNQTAVAILAQTPVSNLIGSFFLGFNRPLLPVEVFSNKYRALSWLMSVKNGE